MEDYKVGILTGGGDCAGINALIEGLVKTADHYGVRVIGILEGWKGLTGKNPMYKELNWKDVDGISQTAGTILGTSRTNPYPSSKDPNDDSKKVLANLESLGLTHLVTHGGDDTNGVGERLSKEDSNTKIVGTLKTMDRNLLGGESTGFDSAVYEATRCVNNAKTTAQSNGWVYIFKFLGREEGHVALNAGIAGGADVIAIPEVPFDVDIACNHLRGVHSKRSESSFHGRGYALVVCAESFIPTHLEQYMTEEELENVPRDNFDNILWSRVNLDQMIAETIEEKTGFSTRVVAPQHIIRGGTATANDVILGKRYGTATLTHILQNPESTGVAITNVLENGQIETMPISEAIKQRKVDIRQLKLYESMGVCFGR